MVICGQCLGLTLMNECDRCENTGSRRVGQCLDESKNSEDE